jgi:hypothetical protein
MYRRSPDNHAPHAVSFAGIHVSIERQISISTSTCYVVRCRDRDFGTYLDAGRLESRSKDLKSECQGGPGTASRSERLSALARTGC